MRNTAPIALFVYNRPEHTLRTIQSLQENNLANQSLLFIFSDGPKGLWDFLKAMKVKKVVKGLWDSLKAMKVNKALKDMWDYNEVLQVRKLLSSISGFNKIEVISRKKNLGLARSIIDGVTTIVNEYGKIIVLEDDMITSPYFLEYMNDALDMYENEKKVACIHAWNFPIEPKSLPQTFFLKGADCWGWATWKRAWEKFNPDGKELLDQIKKRNLAWEFDREGCYPYTKMLEHQIAGKNNSWAIRWHASAQLAGMYCLHPGKSLVENIGLDGSGVHSGIHPRLMSKANTKKLKLKKRNVSLDQKDLDVIKKYCNADV